MATVAVVSAFNVTSFPEGGGHFWVYMQYVQGLRQLGCDVYWMESLRGPAGGEPDAAALSSFLAKIERFGLGGKVILYLNHRENGAQALPREYAGMAPSD